MRSGGLTSLGAHLLLSSVNGGTASHMDDASERAIESALTSPVVALDTEAEPLSPEELFLSSRCRITAASICSGTRAKPIPHGWLFQGLEPTSFNLLRKRLFEPLFAREDCIILIHNKAHDLQVLGQYGIRPAKPQNVYDTMVLAWLCDERVLKGLKEQAKLRLGVTGALTFKQTEAELKKILRLVPVLTRERAQLAWKFYAELRKGVAKAEAPPKERRKAFLSEHPQNWHKFVADLAKTKMVKAEVMATVTDKFLPVFERKQRKVHDEKFLRYAIQDAEWCFLLYFIYLELIEKEDPRLLEVFKAIENPVVEITQEMQEHGVRVNRKRLRLKKRLTDELVVESDAQVAAAVKPYWLDKDTEFNPRSSPQLKELFWERLQFQPPPWVKPGADGQPPTDVEVLKYLAEQGHEIPRLMMASRAQHHHKSNFTDPLWDMSGRDPHHRVHCNIQSIGASDSGRMSASGPNLMQQPNEVKMPYRLVRKCKGSGWKTPPKGMSLVRNDDGSPKITEVNGKKYVTHRVKGLRSIFVPEPGWDLVVVDLSQIELRMMAHLSQDRALMEAYTRWDCAACGKSGHTDIALFSCPNCGAPPGSRDKSDLKQPAVKDFCLGLDIHTMTGVMTGLIDKFGFKHGRRLSKNVNFGLIYGMRPKLLALLLGIDVETATEVHERYFENYYGVARYHDHIRAVVRKKGYLKSIVGRRFRADAEDLELLRRGELHWRFENSLWNKMYNVRVQGGAADVLKLWLLKCRRDFTKAGLRRELRQYTLTDQVRMLLPVHDEIASESRPDKSHEVLDLKVKAASACIKLSVPILAEGGIAKDWGSAK